ncbi:amidohydrolase family protein [Pseudidiomarina aestuarii]|uniref:amidohydrolase family protein n=1 Tax=Pseudidiomarina aestuarii TaxID=624146 RepID=UPI003A987F34
MKKCLLVCLLGGLGLALADANASDHESSVLYHNATLINPASEQQLNDGWMLVKNGRIVEVGQQEESASLLPTADQRVDLNDQYVLPGLVDVHLHLTAGPQRVEMKDGQPTFSMHGHSEITRYHAISTLATGITSAFSPAGDPTANAEYVKHQQSGEWLGPDLRYAGFIFEPTPIAGGSVYPQTETEWQAEISRQKSLGVTAIKLYTGLNEAELALGHRLAKTAGLDTVAHLDQVSWQYAADLGVDALTHALPTSADLLVGANKETYLSERENPYSQRFIYRWFDYVDYDSEPMQSLITTLSDQQTRVDLTLVVNELFYFSPELETLYPESEMWALHPTFRSRWHTTMAAPSYDWTAEDFADAQEQLPKVQELFKRLYDADVPLAIGTDSVASGPFYLRELQLVQATGLSNWQVLELATVAGARHMGLADIGELAPGFAADFIVLTANPLIDLTALNTVKTVVQRGVTHDVAELKAQLPLLSDVQL